mgnify:CR=1 FL=1
MFSRRHVIAALETKRDRFRAHDRQAGEEWARYRQALDTVTALSQAELASCLSEVSRPGARPTAERVAGCPLVRPFDGVPWANHQEARAWALEVLQGADVQERAEGLLRQMLNAAP